MPRNLKPNSENIANFGTGIVGKTFTIIHTKDVKPNDVIIDFQVINIGYEVPTKVKKIHAVTDEFYEIEFEGRKKLRYVNTCIFGRLVCDQ